MMKKIYKENQLLESKQIYHQKVIESIKVTIYVLNENYGVNRDIESDLGWIYSCSRKYRRYRNNETR